VQRAGRLRRHRRDALGNRHDGPDERGAAILGLHAPVPGDSATKEWFWSFLPGAAVVYPDHGRLWLSARWLEEHAGFRMPEDARALIESVYGEGSGEAMPEALRGMSLRAEAQEAADRALARQNALVLDCGYRATPLAWMDDAFTPTRLGEATVAVRLVRATPTGLEPWHPGLDRPWERSEVQVRRTLVAGEDPASAGDLEALRQRMPDGGRYCILAVLQDIGGRWRGTVTDVKRELQEVDYSPERGLLLGG
jgi:CRISPR-associated endonuclease/helicase Cas3